MHGMVICSGIAFFSLGIINTISCNEQAPQHFLGPIDQIVLERCAETYGIDFLLRKFEQQEIIEFLAETEIARKDKSELSKAMFKKLHTIKNKSRYESVQVDTYSCVCVPWSSVKYSVKDADPLLLQTCFTDMSRLRMVLAQYANKLEFPQG